MEDKFKRDNNSGALLSKDNDGLKAYKTQKKLASRMNDMEETMKDMKSDINSILEILLKDKNEK